MPLTSDSIELLFKDRSQEIADRTRLIQKACFKASGKNVCILIKDDMDRLAKRTAGYKIDIPSKRPSGWFVTLRRKISGKFDV